MPVSCPYIFAFSNRFCYILFSQSDGIRQVIALGGIEEKNIPLIASLHFGGAAILGALWGKAPSVINETSIIKRYKQLDIWQ